MGNAINGDVLGTVLVDPTWTGLRLKTEIANNLGITTTEQQLFGDAPTDTIQNDVILEELLARQESLNLRLLRSRVTPPNRLPPCISIEVCDGISRVTWVVDASKLRMNTKSFVSPGFHLEFGNQNKVADFKFMIYAQNATSLKKAGGKGHIQLKCDRHIEENMELSVAIANETDVLVSTGPFVHNFYERAAWRSTSSKKINAGFDFEAAAGLSSSFLVCLTICPASNSKSM